MSPRRVEALGLAVLLGVASLAGSAKAEGQGTKALAITDLDDAMACLPLDGGGVAVASGGGLAIVAEDGSVRRLTALDGLPDTRVHALAADGDSLWVGTDTGAARVSLGPVPAVTRTVALGDAAVHAVLATPTGVYLGTWGAGLLHLDRPDATPELVRSSAPGKHIAALAEHEGSLYVAYADGPVARLDRGALTPLAGTPSHGQALLSLPRGGTGPDLVVGDLEGIFRVGDGATPLAPVDARGMAASGSQLLVATYGAGLVSGMTAGALHREQGVPRFARGVAVRGALRCVATTEGAFVDRDGGGWQKLALGRLPSNDVTALETSGRRVAVGTFDHGATVLEGDKSHKIEGLEPTETVNAVAWQGEGSAAVLWLGTAHGVVRVAPNGTLLRLRAPDGLPSSTVRALAVMPDGRLLVGTDEGAAFVQGQHVVPLMPKAKGPAPLASPMHATWSVAVSADGTLWLGTMAGLYAGKDGTFTRMAVATGELRDDWVTALVLRGPDVFVGTYAGGVTRLRGSASGSERLQHAHLGGGCVNPAGLVVVGDRLYAATMEGLLARPADRDGAPWEASPAAAPGRDVTGVRKLGDALWVASRRGIGVL